MKIKDWENYINSRYKVKKLTNTDEIKSFFPSYKEQKYNFVVAYRYGEISYFIYLKNKTEYKILSLQETQKNKNSNFIYDYNKFINFYHTLEKTHNIEQYCKDIEENFNLKKLKWDMLSLEEKDVFEKYTTFNIESITEDEISNDKFYAAYQFEEESITKRKVIPTLYMGLTTMIVFVESKDQVNISQISMRDSGGLTTNELELFYNDINPFKNEKRL